jgi:zinc transport system substrate-binding protein
MRRYPLLFLAFLLAVAGPVSSSVDPAPLKIVTTIFPLCEFAREISSGRGEVSLLLPPGAGVHTWQPRASDILRLSSADLFIQVGAGLEPWIGGLLKSAASPKLRVLAVADALSISGHSSHQEGEEENDPHIWLDFNLDEAIVDRIGAELAAIDPEGVPVFQAGAARLKAKLRKLDGDYAQELSRCPVKAFIVGGHAAFGYLAKRYGLEQLALSGLSPDAEPLPSRLLSAVDWGRKNRVRAVFAEANASPKMAEVLAKELGVEVLVLHAAANLNKKEWESGLTFFDIMEVNLLNLRKGLGCE